MVRRFPFAIVLVCFALRVVDVYAVRPEKSGLNEKEEDALGKIGAEKGLRYFSGYLCVNHAHPAVYAYRLDGAEKIVVVGNAFCEEFPIKRLKEAMKRYQALVNADVLVSNERRKARDKPELSAMEKATLINITSAQGFRFLSGNVKSGLNHPALYFFQIDSKPQVRVLGDSSAEDVPFNKLDEAVEKYKSLLKKNGYHPE
jgi:hypothetical protein